MKNNLDSILNVIGRRSYKVTTKILRIALIPTLIGLGWYARGIYEENRKREYYPEIAEVTEAGLTIEDKYRLDYNPNLSTDPNKVVFTSYKYNK